MTAFSDVVAADVVSIFASIPPGNVTVQLRGDGGWAASTPLSALTDQLAGAGAIQEGVEVLAVITPTPPVVLTLTYAQPQPMSQLPPQSEILSALAGITGVPESQMAPDAELIVSGTFSRDVSPGEAVNNISSNLGIPAQQVSLLGMQAPYNVSVRINASLSRGFFDGLIETDVQALSVTVIFSVNDTSHWSSVASALVVALQAYSSNIRTIMGAPVLAQVLSLIHI